MAPAPRRERHVSCHKREDDVTDRTQAIDTDTHRQVVELFADLLQLDPGEIGQDARRDDYEQWDSVNHLRLVMDLEQTFGITLTDDDVLGIASLRDAESVLRRHGVGSSGL